MWKIATPQHLQAELRSLLAYSQEAQPQRQVLASELRALADRVAADRVAAADEHLADDAQDLVAAMDIQIRKLQSLTRECKGKADLASPLKHAMKSLVEADRSLRMVRDNLKGG